MLRHTLKNSFIKYQDVFSEFEPMSAGFPQESVLGPILYGIYTSDLARTECTMIATHSDDTAIVSANEVSTRASQHLLAHLNKVCLPIQRLRLLPPAAARRCLSSGANEIVLVSPVPPSRFEEMIAKATPHFLGEEGLSRCLPPCTTGERARAFQATARKSLDSGLGVLAEDLRGNVVGGILSYPLHRDEIIGVDIHFMGADIEDLQERHILRFLSLIHQRLDLFSVLGISEIVDFSLMFVEKTYREQGLATQLAFATVKQAAELGFLAGKGDCTSLVSARLSSNVLTYICSVPFTEYTSNGEVIFANATPPDDVIRVLAARLQRKEPFTVSLTQYEVNEARRNYLAHSKNI